MCYDFLPYFKLFNETFYIIKFMFLKMKKLVKKLSDAYPNAEISHKAIWKMAVSYLAICKTETSYPAICKIANFYRAICKIAICYREICEIVVF